MPDETIDVIELSDDAFASWVGRARFEELREASEGAVARLRNREIGFDAISLVLRRVRAMLDECEARILRVEEEVAQLEEAEREG